MLRTQCHGVSATHPQRSGTLELLRPATWLNQSLVLADGSGLWGHLQVEEWGLDGLAKVLAVAPCPEITEGPGGVAWPLTTLRIDAIRPGSIKQPGCKLPTSIQAQKLRVAA